MNIEITASDNSTIYKGDIDDMPEYGYFVDIFEEAVNQNIESGETENGWTWKTYSAPTITDIKSAASALGKLGGSRKSPAKTKACRENGKKPKRPRKIIQP